MEYKKADSHKVQIFIAGDYAKAVDVCREFCAETPWCVSVAKTDFVYTGGMESGVCVTAINYARFPASIETTREKAEALASLLCKELYQRTYTIIDGEESRWFHGDAQ